MSYRYFIHRACPFYPCHDLIEWKSCLFCWCPLYLLDCGGNYTFTRDVKDCSACTIPHTAEGYDYIVKTVSGQVFGK
jgi:Zn-finger protein